MSTPLKAILWSPTNAHTGFCDRLRGIAAGAVFAEHLGARLFVKWDPCEPCPVDYLDVFQESKYFSTRWEAENFEILHYWDCEFNVMPLDLSRKFREKVGCEDRIVLSDDFVMERWGEILRSLEPLPSISRKIAAIRRRTDPSRMLGVHLRRTDVLHHQCKEITRENVNQYDRVLWSRILLAVEGGEIDQIYLASDDLSYFERWKEKLSELPVRLHHNEATWGTGLRQTPLEDLLVDLYLLSSCRKVYGSVWSSVFFVGGALGGDFEILPPPTEPAGKSNSSEDEAKVIAWSSTGEGGLTAVTVCVNYADYLAGILENREYFDEWIIVTTAEDLETRELCEREGLKCLVTDVFYAGGDSFNKARGLNLALKEVKEGSWIVALDSDILLPKNFRERLDEEKLDPNCLYGLKGRCVCRDAGTLEILKVCEPWDALVRDQTPWVLGYFQLFHPGNRFARRFNEGVSSNASAYDDQFSKDFGLENLRYLSMTGVHLGEINIHWNGREAGDDDALWAEGSKRDSLTTILGDLWCHQQGPAVLHVGDDSSVLGGEIREFAGSFAECHPGDRRGGPEGEFNLIVLSAALKAEDFHPLFREVLPRLKQDGGIIAPFFDASKWPEWTATLALRLGMPERTRQDGWCLIRPDLGGVLRNFIEPIGLGLSVIDGREDEGAILLPITSGFVTKVPLALHSLRKFWRGRIALAVPSELPGPWERTAATYQAELTRVDLPRSAEWNDQWGREVERFSLVTTKGLLALPGEKVVVWHPETICLRSPECLFGELGAGEIFFLYWPSANVAIGKSLKISHRVVTGSEAVLRSCEDRLAEGLRVPSSRLASRNMAELETLFETFSKGMERLVSQRYFRSVHDFGDDESESGDLVGIVFPDGSEASGKLVCEHWADVEDEVVKSFSCEIPAAQETTVAVRVNSDSLPSFYFNFRLWRLPESVSIHVFYSDLSENDFFFLDEQDQLHLHDLDAEGHVGCDWIRHACNVAEGGQLAVISPKWKPRPGASLRWPEEWGDSMVCGSHSKIEVSFREFLELEKWGDARVKEEGMMSPSAEKWGEAVRHLRLECLDGDFSIFDLEFLRGIFSANDGLPFPNSDPLLVIWYGALRTGQSIQKASLETLGWIIEEYQTDGDEEVTHSESWDEMSLITLSNGGYADYTLNCFQSLHRLGEKGARLAEKMLCYSLGRECHERMLAGGCRSNLIDDEEHSGFQPFRQGAWAEVVKYKFDAISRELLENEFACYTDGDIVFESTDFLDECVERMIREDVELLIQNDTANHQDDDHSNLCSGFMMIRSTENTRKVFSYEAVLPSVDAKFSDQLYVNSVIKHRVRTSVLPLASYPNGAYLQAFGPSSEAMLYHFNYLVGHQKREAMMKAGKWYL